MKMTCEAAFETTIESVLQTNGYTRVPASGLDRERAIFPDEALSFIRATQGKLWEKPKALQGEQTDARILDRSLDKTQLDAMRAGLEAIRPEGVKVVILDSACQLQIIKSPNTMITLEGSKI